MSQSHSSKPRPAVDDFGRFLASASFVGVADGVALVAWVWLASILTRDPLLVALVPAALRWPRFFLALPSGLFADRHNRLRIIRLMDASRALVLVSVTGAIWSAEVPIEPPSTGLAAPALYVWLLLGATVSGAAEVFRNTAARAFLPQIVASQDLESANSKLGGVELVGSTMIGPALGAFLIGLDPALPFGFNALAYATAVLAIVAMRGRYPAPPARPRLWKHEMVQAWQFLRATPNLLYLAAITAFWGFFLELTMVAIVLHARENLGVSPETYGLILAGSAVGGIIGGIFGARWVRAHGAGRIAQIAVAMSIPWIFLCALAGNALMLTLVLGLLQLSFLLWNIVSVAYRQRVIPNMLLGRVNSIYNLFGWLLAPIGVTMAGVISDFGEGIVVRETALILPFFVASLGCAAVALLFWRRLDRIFSNQTNKNPTEELEQNHGVGNS